MHPDQEFVTIARVTKTQGRIGEVGAVLLTDFPERFETRRRLFALSRSDHRRELQLENHWFHKGLVVLKFAGVDSITQAEELIGAEIQIPLSDRAQLEQGSFYLSDLKGCVVISGVGAGAGAREIGRIEDVQFGSGEAPLLVVKGKQEFLIPFAAEFIEKVDVAGRLVSMKLPEGLLEIDAPLSRKEKAEQGQKQQD